jgi:thymidylate synthase
MQQYLEIAHKALNGTRKRNRTGVDTFGYTGEMCKYDLRDGFPILTTKRVAFYPCVAEMLGFLRGYDNATDFQDLGCNVWNANANENEQWVNNPSRLGNNDLGRIYGVQARRWRTTMLYELDQLRHVVDMLLLGKDDRRLIVTHWNPGELGQMALPPCHVMYKFSIENDTLHLCMYQRSCDVPLGVPFNITGYSWLLAVIAHITGFEAGVFTHFMDDVHVYENQAELLEQQLQRTPRDLPVLNIDSRVKTLEDLDLWARPDSFHLGGYLPHGPIKFPFTV